MSVNLMSAIFETTFFDLQDEKGNVLKASTAKLVLLAMADHANDEGEGVYPSVERLCKKTALSEQTIRNAFDALRFNGILYLEGKSKYGTNNHTINTKSFPKAIGKEPVYLTLQPLGGLTDNEWGSNGYLNTPQPLYPNHHITIIETPSKILKTDEVQGTYKPDLVDLELSKLPAISLRKAVQEYFKLNVKWDTKTAREWLEWAHGENITAEQIARAADTWRMDKQFNWQVPTLKGIFEKWQMLMEAAPVTTNTTTLQVDENGVPETY